VFFSFVLFLLPAMAWAQLPAGRAVWSDTTSRHLVDTLLPNPEHPQLYPRTKALSIVERDYLEDLEAVGGRMVSPYHSLVNFLLFTKSTYYYPVYALGSFDTRSLDSAHAILLLQKLKKVLDGRGVYIYLEEVPRDTNYLDSATQRPRYYLNPDYPRLYVERVAGQWMFTQETIKAIPELYSELYPLGIDKVLSLVPGNWKQQKLVGDLSAFSLFLLAVWLLIALLLYRVLAWILSGLALQLLQWLQIGHFVRRFTNPVARPLSIALIIWWIQYFVPALELPPSFTRYLLYSFSISLPVVVTVLAYRLVSVLGAYLKRLAAKTSSKTDDQLLPVALKVIRILIVLVGILFILSNFHFDLTAVIAGLSIGGLALALAAQDTVKNFFGSVMIFVDRPFQIGDWVKLGGDMEGTVEEVGLRATRIRTFYNSLVYVPNALLAEQMVDNMGLRHYRRMRVKLNLQMNTPPDLIEAYVKGLREMVRLHPDTRKDMYEIHLNDVSASSLEVQFYIFFRCPSWSEELEARQEVLLGIVRLAHALGIRFAYPTQTLHVETVSGQPAQAAPYEADARRAQEQVRATLAAIQAGWRAGDKAPLAP
jgi:MscS family membrane protein